MILTSGDNTFDNIMEQRAQNKAVIRELETRVAQADILLAAMLKLNEQQKLEWTSASGDRWVVYERKASKPRSEIDPVKLLNQNVPAHVIEAARVYSKPGKAGITVRKLGDKEEGENGTEG